MTITMGHLQYAPDQTVEIDDALLGHLEAAIISKLRRSEPFALRLDEAAGAALTVWISPGIPLVFSYAGARPQIDRPWLEALVETANTPAGLRLLQPPPAS
jgi:hypothetical protein